MRKHFRKLFAALAFATLGPLGCVVGDSAPEEDTPALEETYLGVNDCTRTCDFHMELCMTYPERCPECTHVADWSVQKCISAHQSCLLACPQPLECRCESGSWCCRTPNGGLECSPQGTCSGGGEGGGGDGGGGGGGGGGGCDDDWDCSPIEECSSSGSCVPLGCG
jgi:uncharacterized membrane protein YgcG